MFVPQMFVPQMFVPENGRHGNALAISIFRRCARLRSRAHDFHCSIEKRCGKLGRYVSFTKIHVLYTQVPSGLHMDVSRLQMHRLPT